MLFQLEKLKNVTFTNNYYELFLKMNFNITKSSSCDDIMNFTLERKVRFCQFYAVEWYLFLNSCL